MIPHPVSKSLKMAIHSLHGYSTLPEAVAALNAMCRPLIPEFVNDFNASGQPVVTGARQCCYADTPTGDFVVDWVPGLGGVMVAGGGSGHGFKFLPVLGEQVVKIMEGRDGIFREKWKWPNTDQELIMKGDGSRGVHEIQ